MMDSLENIASCDLARFAQPFLCRFLCFARPRYQVSVYRTIGPLVFIFMSS